MYTLCQKHLHFYFFKHLILIIFAKENPKEIYTSNYKYVHLICKM